MSQNNREVHENDKTLETKSYLKSFFTFKIENFIDLNDSEIKSSEFSIGDTKWYVKVYPRYIKDNIEYISAYLCLSKSERYVNEAKYKVSVINNKSLLINTMTVPITDFTNQTGWGYYGFMRRERLTQDLLPNNQLKLRFEIDLFDCDLYHENRITYDLHKLINNKKYSDFVFIVDNKEFFAHKNILSIRSKVFEAMFSSDMIESQSNRCTIDDIESEVFEELLTFIYTGNAPKAQTMAEKLLAAAEKYEILEIKDFCANIIFKDMKNENAIQNLKIANKYKATKLLDKIIEFIAINFQPILNISYNEWEKFIVENPKLMTKILKATAKKV
jgi:speckle-type POZ protein